MTVVVEEEAWVHAHAHVQAQEELEPLPLSSVVVLVRCVVGIAEDLTSSGKLEPLGYALVAEGDVGEDAWVVDNYLPPR